MRLYNKCHNFDRLRQNIPHNLLSYECELAGKVRLLKIEYVVNKISLKKTVIGLFCLCFALYFLAKDLT